MKSSKKTGRAPRRRISIALKLLALVCVAFVALLLLLPHPPDIEPGGKTAVIKRIPDLRDTVDPLARVKAPEAAVPSPSPSLTPPPAPQRPQQEPPPPAPRIVLAPPEPAPPAPVRKPEYTAPPALPSQSDRQPSPPTLPEIDIARLPPEPAPAGRVDLPSKSDIREWVKSQAWEFLGGVDELGNILYRFEVWLDAPASTLNAIKSVTYAYDAPSATPPSRESDIPKDGFRVRFGGLSCAQKVTVILTMSDGRSRRAVVDGCRALN